MMKVFNGRRIAAIHVVVLIAAIAAAAAAAADRPPVPTTVILVRHAEKVDASRDPGLSAAGEARAAELARVLGSAGVTKIYVTPFARTRATAAPLANSLGIEPSEVRTGPEYAGQIAALIRAEHDGETVLVVGHSNSTQNVMRALGVANVPPIAESQYDDLFVVTLAEGAAPRLVALRYGAPAR